MIRINPEFKSYVFALKPEEYENLEKSILRDGCRYPIVLWNNYIIDGHNRYEICTKHSIEFKTIEINSFKDKEEVLEWIDQNQIGRRNLTEDQFRFSIGRLYNREKKIQGGTGSNQYKKQSGQNDHSAKTATKIAKAHGVSEKTVRRAAKFAKEVEKDPEIEEAIKKRIPIKQVKKERRKKQREEKAKELAEWNEEKLAAAKPGLILADPPWQYDFSETDSRQVENQYTTMTVEEIIADKPEVDDDAVLFLWATAPKLLEALQVMKDWGFNYVTNAMWDNETIGLGYWFRGQHELLLVGKRGKPPVPDSDKRVSSVFREKRGEHSEKPSCVYEWIEKAYPDLIKKEMYQRKKRECWVGHGNDSRGII